MINGDYNILYIKWQGQFLPIGCLTSDSFTENCDMIDSMTMNSASWRTRKPTNQSYNISFDGLVKNTNLDRLRVLKRSGTLIEWKTQDSNLVFVDSGFGYINSLSKSSSIDEFISFNATIEGFGKPFSYSSLTFNLQNLLQHKL